MQLTDSDFTRLYTYVKNSYGIDLSKKKQLISSRLNNMLIQQGYRDFTQYTDEIISGKNPPYRSDWRLDFPASELQSNDINTLPSSMVTIPSSSFCWRFTGIGRTWLRSISTT